MSIRQAIEPAELRHRVIRYRRQLLEVIHHAGAGHTGGSLSCLDILAVLYHRVLNVSPERVRDPARDRYVQSKGHSVEALYVVLAGCGFIEEKALYTLCRYRSPLVGHPTRKTPGIEQNTGALGHGLSVSCGMALGGRKGTHPYRVFTLMGDGELAEGSNWEAALFASHHGLDNLTAIIDRNRLQITGLTGEVLNTEPLRKKWEAFGWAVREVNGHDLDALTRELESVPFERGRPSLLLAHTVKGKGVSFMEDQKKWHHGVPDNEQLQTALAELESASGREVPGGSIN